METKTCRDCKIGKPITEYYSSQRKKVSGEEYTFYRPDCKSCVRNRTKNWQVDNSDYYKKLMKTHNEKPKNKQKRRSSEKRRRDSGEYANWQNNNKDKMYEYGKEKRQNKTHNISSYEWNSCKSYFNYSCAYCGLNIDNHYTKFRGEMKLSDFHKEHVVHEGSNDLSNCVPSCKSCNSKKWLYDFEKWYNKENEIYDVNRYNKIIEWLENGHLIYIEAI